MVVCGIFSVLVRYGAIPPSLFPAFRLVIVDPGFISLTILPRKPSPSASKHFKSSWQASTHHSFILQSAGVAPTLQTLYGTAEYHGRYGVLIHYSYPYVRLFHSLLRGDFHSRWLQLLQWPMMSLLGVPDEVEESLLQN
jgi:hypothetical protein